jgi:hypothetical protein
MVLLLVFVNSLTILLSVTVTLTSAASCGQFSDVSQADYFYHGVVYLNCRQVVSGYSDGTFRPGNNVTRAQFAKIISLHNSTTIGCTTGYPAVADDVPVGAYFYDCVETAIFRGYMRTFTGDPAHFNPCMGQWETYGRIYFRPCENATRAELAEGVVRSAGASGYSQVNPPTATFGDVPPGHPYYQAIETAFVRGLISGYDGDPRPNYLPNNPMTRGQLAKVVTNAGFYHIYAVSVSPFTHNYEYNFPAPNSTGLETVPQGALDIYIPYNAPSPHTFHLTAERIMLGHQALSEFNISGVNPKLYFQFKDLYNNCISISPTVSNIVTNLPIVDTVRHNYLCPNIGNDIIFTYDQNNYNFSADNPKYYLQLDMVHQVLNFYGRITLTDFGSDTNAHLGYFTELAKVCYQPASPDRIIVCP